MFDLPLHPAIVHVPLGILVLVPFAALLLVLRSRRIDLSATARFLAVGLQSVVLVGALLAMRTGEEDEELVEEVVAEAAIEEHEEAAEVLVWLVGLGVVMLGAAGAVPPGSSRRGLAATGLLLSVVTLGWGMRVGHLGGELVYAHGAGLAHGTRVGDGGEGVGEPGQRGDDHDGDEDSD